MKPRSKLAAFQEQRKKLSKKDNKSLIEKEVQSQLIKVKSLETLVAQHKNSKVNKDIEYSDIDNTHVLKLNEKDRLNYVKTVKFLQRLRLDKKPQNTSFKA